MKQLGIYLAATFVALAAFFTGTLNKSQPLGSVSQGSEYYSTSTKGFTANITYLPNCLQTFGSIVNPQSQAGWFDFYDATTTNINLRTGRAPTSTILVGSAILTNVGTFTYDARLYNGLIVIGTDTTGVPTTTITCR